MNAPQTLHGMPALIPLHLIDTAEQVRTRNGFDEASLSELAETIKAVGLIQPITVESTGDRFRVLAGERRLLACSMAGLAEIPCFIRVEDTSPARIAAQAVENLARVDLCLADRADAVAKLVQALGRDAARKMLGKSPAWISKVLSYHKLSQAVRSAAEAGQCEDWEILNAVDQLGRMGKKDEKALAAFVACIDLLADGKLTREDARAKLAKFNKGEPVKTDTGGKPEAGEGEEGEAPEPTGTGRAADLSIKLEAQDAILLRDLLAIAVKHDPSERSKKLHAMLRDAVNNAYGV